MRIGFLFPAALWLLLLVVPLWALAWLTPRRRAPAGRWASLALRTLMIATLVFALAGLRVVRDTPDLTTVFLLDRSDSVAPAERARADAFLRDAQRAMRPGDRSAVVAFGANALVERAPGEQPAGDAQSAVVPAAAGTNIQEAVQLGLALLPAETNKRLVLLSDGGENAGDAQVAARLVAARRVPLSYVDLGAPAGAAEALVNELHAPAAARAGQTIELVATIESNVAQAAHLRILAEGQPIAERDVELQPGMNRFPVQVAAQGAGFQRYRAEIVPQQDTRAENNAAEALIRINGAPKVLLVEGQPGAGQSLKDALAAAQVNADLIAPNALPQGLGWLGAYEAVVLVNAPASALPPSAMTDLAAYVHDLGKGLVMVGGDQSFGLGGYAQTPIEDALPVAMTPPSTAARPRLAIIYLLDKSSSMDACHCRGNSREKDGFFDHKGRPKIDLGKDAVIASVKVLNQNDNVGVIAFDNVAHTIVPLQPGHSPEEVQAAIGPIPPKGATNVAAGLQAAEDALQQSDAQLKHVIILTDGWSQEGDPMGIAQRMYQTGVTLSVVAEGTGSAPFLQQLADTGGGRFFPVQRMEDVPQIFLQETLQASSNFLVEKPFTPQYGAKTPILAGLENGLPQLYGYNGVEPKQTATIGLSDANGAPVLAQWQYGLGRAVAWTSDASGRWAKDWISWPEFPRFAAQLVGWALPSAADSGMNVDVRSTGAETQIEVTLPAASVARDGLELRATLLGADGAKQELPLAEQSAGVYRASIPSPPQGTYMVQVAGTQGAQVVIQDTAALVVPYAAEYRPGQSNLALLAALAQATGGTQLVQPADAFAPAAQGAGSPQEFALPLLLLALLLLPLDILLRRTMALWRTRAA